MYPLQNGRSSKLATHGFVSKSDIHHKIKDHPLGGLLFWLIDGRTRKAALRKALNGLFNRRGFSAEKRVQRMNFAGAFRVCRQIRTRETVEMFTNLCYNFGKYNKRGGHTMNGEFKQSLRKYIFCLFFILSGSFIAIRFSLWGIEEIQLNHTASSVFCFTFAAFGLLFGFLSIFVFQFNLKAFLKIEDGKKPKFENHRFQRAPRFP